MVRTRILDPYTRRVDDTRHRIARVALFFGLVLLAMLMGFVLAILPMNFMLIPMTPILLLAVLALWIAPDMERNYDATVRKLLLLFFATSMVWPDYIAISMPGIGWISPQRAILAVLVFVSLYALAISSATRAHVHDVISHQKVIYWAFILFFALQLILAFAWVTFSSRLFFAQFFWYYMFILAAWTYANPNTVRRLYQIVLVGFAVQCIYGALEWWLKRPAWAGYVPDFLIVDPELIGRIFEYSSRAGTDVFRISSQYLTPLTFAEAIAIFLPFVIFAIFYGRNAWMRIAAFALMVLAFYNGIWTDARSAMIGFIIAPVGIIGLWAVQRYRRRAAERDIVAPAVIWAYPAAIGVLTIAVLTGHRIRVAVLGGAQHQPSNNAREEMWRRTWDLLERNPLGYGPFTAAGRVGYTNRAGNITIDGYAMNLLVDYGIIGFALFVTVFLDCVWLGIRTFLRSANHEEDIAGPLAISVVNFLVIKLVLSQMENHHFMFAMLGCIVALHWRQEERLKAEAAERPPPLAEAASARASPGPLIPAGGYGVAAAR